MVQLAEAPHLLLNQTQGQITNPWITNPWIIIAGKDWEIGCRHCQGVGGL